jgi:hypothetical protein
MTDDDLLSRRPRTRLSFSEADMARLRDLYYDRDVPMTQIAKSFGISTSTLYHWIAEMDWPRRSATFPIRTQPHRAAVEVGQAGAAPHPAGGEKPLDPDRLAIEVAAAARCELAAMGGVSGPMSQGMSLLERKRRADVIASLSRSIQRIDKSFEARAEREALKRLVKKQQDRLYALENAGMIEAQQLTLAALKQEFAAATGGETQPAPLKARR